MGTFRHSPAGLREEHQIEAMAKAHDARRHLASANRLLLELEAELRAANQQGQGKAAA